MSDEHDDTPDEQARTLSDAAERMLTEMFGGPVRLGALQSLRDKYRNRVLRCPVIGGPAGVPASVIVKAAVGEGEHAFDPAKDDLGDTAWRFFNEWAGTRFLNEVGGNGPALCARLLGGDKATGLLVLEDLGERACLADRLQGNDPEAAALALLRYAASLGRLHARTVGRENEWRQTRRALGGSETTREREGVRWLRENVEPLRKQLDALGIAPAPGWDDEIAQVQQTLDDPGPWNAFSPSDTCPDNHRLPEVPGGYLRFFDFEFGGFRHALLDAAYFFAPFPTCWCVNRLPGDLPPKMEAAYRAELARGGGFAAGGDDVRFDHDLACACAYWTVASVSWSLEKALGAGDNDKKWGLSTHRQRHPLRLDNFSNLAEERGHLPALAQTVRALAGKLRELWPADEADMPFYPPFRASAAPTSQPPS